MYLEHFGLREPPFRITPHTDFFFPGARRGATLEALLYAILHEEGIVKVSGEVGSGKTMLCRVLMERLPATVDTLYIANPTLMPDGILFAFGRYQASAYPSDSSPTPTAPCTCVTMGTGPVYGPGVESNVGRVSRPPTPPPGFAQCR